VDPALHLSDEDRPKRKANGTRMIWDIFAPSVAFRKQLPRGIRTAVSYVVIWKMHLKDVSASRDDAAQTALFSEQARRVYGLPPA